MQPSAMPVLSVIVPVRNDPGHLRLCLAAIKQSQYPHYELIVVDDASTDATPEVAQELGAIVLKMDQQSGPGLARNRGVTAARGTYLMFVDADVCVHPQTLGNVVAAFGRDPGIDALFGSYDLEPGEKDFLSQYKNLTHRFVHQQSAGKRASTFWAGCGAIKKTVFEEVGGFSSEYTRPCIEDIELGARMYRAGKHIAIIGDVEAKHLKKWTFSGIIKSDVKDRGIPWTRLILRKKNLPNDLNLTFGQRLAALLSGLLVLALVAMILRGAGWLMLPWEILIPAAAALALGIVLLNRRYYAFFTKLKGPWFALRVFPMHVLYYLYSGAALAIGTVSHMMGSSRKSTTPGAQVGRAVQAR
jgi:glycosyltransferase involved in cell wall biosynthesis